MFLEWRPPWRQAAEDPASRLLPPPWMPARRARGWWAVAGAPCVRARRWPNWQLIGFDVYCFYLTMREAEGGEYPQTHTARDEEMPAWGVQEVRHQTEVSAGARTVGRRVGWLRQRG